MKIYYARHQSLGVLTQFPFLEHPSAEQLAAVRGICDASQGTHHPKERVKPEDVRVPYWMRVVEETVYGPTDIPSAPVAPTSAQVSGSAASGIGDVTVSATGRVTEVITTADVGVLDLGEG